MNYRNEKSLAPWFGWGTLALVAALFVFPLRSRWPGDYYGFWAAGQFAGTSGIHNLYGAGESRRIAAAGRTGLDAAPAGLEREMRTFYGDLDLTASPFNYAVYRLISTGRFERDYDRVRILGFTLYLSGIVVFALYLKFPPWSLGLLAWMFTMPFFPFRRDVFDQNGSAGIAGAVMLSLASLRWRHPAARIGAGAALALLTAFKPTVLYAPFFVFLDFALNDGEALVWFSTGLMAGGLVALVIPMLLFGAVCAWPEWLRHATERAFEVRGIAGGILGRDLHVSTALPYQILSAAFLVGCATAFVFISRLPRPLAAVVSPFRPAGLQAICAGAGGLNVYLLTGMLVWGHYFTLAVPSALIAMRPRPNFPLGSQSVWLVGLIATFAVGLQHYFQLWGWSASGNYSLYTLGGTLVLLGIVLWDMRESRTLRPAA